MTMILEADDGPSAKKRKFAPKFTARQAGVAGANIEKSRYSAN